MPNFDRSKLSDAILQVVKDEGGRPLPQFVLLKKLIANYRDQGFIDSKDVTSVVGELSSQKKLFVLKSGCIVLEQNGGKKNYDKNRDFKNRPKPNIDMTKTLTGTININSAGNGFITLVGEKESKYYVHKSNLNHAQNGDTVVFNPTDFATKGDLIDAVVSSVTEHAKGFYVGEFILEKDGSYSVKPDDEKFTLKITLDDINGLVNGSKILFKINQYESETAHATVSRVIGHKSDVGSDILSIVYDNGVEPDFPDPVIDYAKKLTLDFDEQAKKVRKNLCDKPIITIDPATSKDFDDAFYCEKNPDGTFLLAVQIADVSHYVKYNSILDEEALKRGCSIYLVDRVIPMLPHNLSDDLCSINPNVERFALACDMIIDQKGEFKDIKVYPCIIKSHRRFAYEEVNEYFAKKTDFSKEEQAVKQSVDVGLELSDILTKMKQKRGYVDFEIPEAQIIVDDKCIPTEIKVRTHGRAQKMIEDFMVAANEAVTIYADKKNLPFVYRIHDKPSEDRMKTFALEAKKMNFKISSKMDDIHGTDISR
jgi:ribonuclease R